LVPPSTASTPKPIARHQEHDSQCWGILSTDSGSEPFAVATTESNRRIKVDTLNLPFPMVSPMDKGAHRSGARLGNHRFGDYP
jgi:hypothetical protein